MSEEPTVNIDELKAALAKATPGEWFVVSYGDGDSLVICKDAAGEHRIAFMATPSCRDSVEREKTWREIRADANLIAMLKSTAPALIAELEALRAENARLKIGLRSIASGEAFKGMRFAEDDDAEYYLRQQRKAMLFAVICLTGDSQ